MAEVIKFQGKNYIRVRDMLIPCNEKGVIKGVTSEQKPNKIGGTDCTVHVNCLRIANSKPKLKGIKNGERNLQSLQSESV